MLSRRLNALWRHRASLCEWNLIIFVVLVMAFVSWQVDIFETEGSVTSTQQTIELDESLLLGGIFAVGLLIYSMRRLNEQKRESRRRLAAEQRVRELAYQDGLTGLSNRRQFDDALRVAIDSPPAPGAIHAVLLLDLNGFKKINDCFGHGTGDEVLIIVAQRLLSAMRGTDLVARFGGDEFAILSKHLIDAEAAASISRRVVQALDAPVSAGNTQHQIGAAIGIALFPTNAATIQELLRKADIALYRAKSEHRSAFRFFEEDMDRLMREARSNRAGSTDGGSDGRDRRVLPTIDRSENSRHCWF